MQSVYDKEGMVRNKQGNKWITQRGHIQNIHKMIEAIGKIEDKFKKFEAKLENEQEDCDENGK